MHRFPLAALVAALAVTAGSVGLVACGGSDSPKIAKDVVSTTGQGASDSSLFTESNLSKAISTYTDKFGTDAISIFKVEPGSLKVTTAKGINIVGADGATSQLKSPVNIPTVGTGFSPKDIDAAAPEKILSSLKSKGVTAANTNYFVVTSATSMISGSDGTPGWLVYSDKGNFQAKPDGSDAKALGTGTGSVTITTPGGTTVDTKKLEDQAKKAATDAQKQGEQIQKQAQGVEDCVAKAGTDPQKLAACAGQ